MTINVGDVRGGPSGSVVVVTKVLPIFNQDGTQKVCLNGEMACQIFYRYRKAATSGRPPKNGSEAECNCHSRDFNRRFPSDMREPQ